MNVLNCRFAEVAVDLCPCDNIIPYETVICKGEGGSLTGFGLVMKQLTSGGVALACYRCLLAANVCL